MGEALHLPDNTFPETEIVTETGVTIGSGVLGQVNGMRALRLKRVPVHATQPRRREADLAELDLPEITALPKPDGAEAKASKATNVDEFVVDSGDDLPAHKNAPVNVEGIERVSDLLCMSNLAHASSFKEHNDNDDIQRCIRRSAERR